MGVVDDDGVVIARAGPRSEIGVGAGQDVWRQAIDKPAKELVPIGDVIVEAGRDAVPTVQINRPGVHKSVILEDRIRVALIGPGDVLILNLAGCRLDAVSGDLVSRKRIAG